MMFNYDKASEKKSTKARDMPNERTPAERALLHYVGGETGEIGETEKSVEGKRVMRKSDQRHHFLLGLTLSGPFCFLCKE